ncbi:MAG: hypothetical protein U9N82_08965 [Thermodesulfobacteriota bacterium]|nr:hypothetical protein [Thermodesulfobacteriota bacterium]
MGIHSSRISEDDLFGRFFLKKPDGVQYENYFSTICAIYPLLQDGDWNECVTGYYINVAGNMDAVRLSFFTDDPQNAINCENDFCSENNIVEIQPCEYPHKVKIAEGYGGEELRFRKFLHMYTLIGIDLINADLLNARCLLATFRLQVMRSRQEYKPHFEGTFKKHSQTYLSLSEEGKEQFWSDLSNWPNPLQVDWAHMMVNMILPGDFVPAWNDFLAPKPSLTIGEINQVVAPMNFQIPVDWEPMKEQIT